ncbi:FUSC family protein [Oleispirillum naphthae]|uniref:FUSC family protein n=1 Tax=Oleispirillum naphthae TaxID=2838853 RepID=UPI00308238B5
MTPREALSAAAPPLRAAIAAVAAYAVSGLLGLPAGHWAALSALIVCRPLPGAASRAGADRMAGTLIGAALACGGALLRAWQVPEVPLLALVLAAAAGVAAVKEGWRTAPIAAVIVLSAAPDGHGALAAALLRLAEISIGAAFGVAAAWGLWPGRSEAAARRLCRAALEQWSAVLDAAEAGEWERGRDLAARARAQNWRLARVIDGARWERADKAALGRLRDALARLSVSTGFALRLMRETASEAAAAHARAVARRDGAALARLLEAA